MDHFYLVYAYLRKKYNLDEECGHRISDQLVSSVRSYAYEYVTNVPEDKLVHTTRACVQLEVFDRSNLQSKIKQLKHLWNNKKYFIRSLVIHLFSEFHLSSSFLANIFYVYSLLFGLTNHEESKEYLS